MRACAFFPPSLDPVLDRGTGHTDSVGAPQVPARRAGGEAVCDDEAHRQVDHAVRRVTARGRQISEVGVKGLTTLRTVGLRIGDHAIPRTPPIEIPAIVQRPLELLVPVSLVTTMRTGVPLVSATVGDNRWLWEVCRDGHTFWRIRSRRTRTAHCSALLVRMLGLVLYDKSLALW